MNHDDLWYEYHDKPRMRLNWYVVGAFLGSLAVDVLVVWALIRLAERWAK
jgi:hypothetical protein